ncbi:MAG TPA: transposase [Actinomycetota bacterium]|nr:transposase [Actinomycetota bacterium]
MCSVRKVHRTARIALRTTPAQRRRCYALLRSAGDVWAWVIDCNRALREWRCPQVANFSALCRELTGTRFGELSRTCAEAVLKNYSIAFFEAARRQKAGVRAGFPRRKRGLVPVRFRWGCFGLDGSRVRLGVARGAPELWVRLGRAVPYPVESIRSVTLVAEAGRLYLDVTAEVPVAAESTEPDRSIVAGIDLGIIHPYAVMAGDEGLLVSGRAIRAEERLHLEDTKRRAQKAAARAPSRGQQGSRRWRCYRASRRKAEARHRRRVRQAHHEAARSVVAWLVDHEVGTVVVGDPKGITTGDCGHRQNLALRNWRRTHLLGCLSDKAELAGIEVVLVNERGTSSTCPECQTVVPRPRGRGFSCPHCGHRCHRDLVGARNIAARGGGSTRAPARVTHRRAGRAPARRDRRRHLFDARRSCPAPGRPGRPGSRSQGDHPGAASVAWRVVHAVGDGALRGSQRSHVDMRGINAGVH